MARFEDHRGVIEDLLQEPLDSVTEIYTRAGCVRGNHVHKQTTQWTYVVYGCLLVAMQEPGKDAAQHTVDTGQLICEEPGVAHAWRALWDTKCLVFTRGPRSGENYESDTVRLAVPLL